MYGWIWRKLPFGLPGKLIGSLIICAGTAALLWFVAFPQLSSFLTPTQSTVDTEGGDDGGGGEDPGDDSDRVTDNPTGYDLESSPEGDRSGGSGD